MLKYFLIILTIQTFKESQSLSQSESPWIVSFEAKGKRCGGAMIDYQHVLTGKK